MYAYINTLFFICCAIDMGEDSDRGSLSEAKLGNTDHRCNLHHLLDSDASDKRATVEDPMLQKATNTHPFSINSCELLLMYVWRLSLSSYTDTYMSTCIRIIMVCIMHMRNTIMILTSSYSTLSHCVTKPEGFIMKDVNLKVHFKF